MRMQVSKTCRLLISFSSILTINFSVGQANAQPTASESVEQELADTKASLLALQKTVEQLQLQIENSNEPSVVELQERVEDLETIAVEVDDAIGGRPAVKSFDAVSLDLGGFFDSSVSLAIGEDNTDASFNRQVFELLAKAKLGDDWEFFVAQAFIRNAPISFIDAAQRRSPTFANNNSPVATDTVIAWGQYHHSDLLNVQFGRFVTPQGIINVEHFPATLLDPEQPMFLRPFSGQSLYANFTNGVNLRGSKFIGGGEISYAAYAGVWAGNATNAAFGGRLAYKIGDTGFTLGLNGSSGDRASGVVGDRFYVGGFDILYDKGRILWKSELFATSEGVGENKLAFYTQPAFRLTDKLLAFYRYDYLDNGETGGESVEHVGGLVYNPINNVRLRSIYRNRRFREDIGLEAAEVNVIQFSSTFNF